MVLDVLLDTLLDALKMAPILYLAYLLMEVLEHHAGEKMNQAIAKVGKAGPLLGAALGVVPQCGFSGAIAGFYAGGVATLGTLIAVFMSTSDEMLPLMISEGARPGCSLNCCWRNLPPDWFSDTWWILSFTDIPRCISKRSASRTTATVKATMSGPLRVFIA